MNNLKNQIAELKASRTLSELKKEDPKSYYIVKDMTKCYSVRLDSLISISNKCYKAIAFDGSEGLIPKSQIYGRDWDVLKSEAYWISAWILTKKSIQYSTKKWANFTKEGKNIGCIEFTHHTPKPIKKVIKHDDSLIR